MRAHVIALVASIAFAGVGCIGPEVASEGAEAELFGDAPTLVFSADFEEWATRPLRAGQVVHVDYDLSRIGPCPTAEGEAPSWGVTARYRVDDGDEERLPLTTILGDEVVNIPASFIVPEGDELAIFFVAEDGAGCAIHDAYYSVDYRFPID